MQFYEIYNFHITSNTTRCKRINVFAEYMRVFFRMYMFLWAYFIYTAISLCPFVCAQ